MLKRLFILLVVCVCNIVVYAADKNKYDGLINHLRHGLTSVFCKWPTVYWPRATKSVPWCSTWWFATA